jgi:hypothetical protein
MAIAGESRVIVDPSVLFGDDDIEWLQDDELRPYLAVSLAFTERLQGAEAGALPGLFESRSDDRLRQIRTIVEGIERFSWRQVEDLQPGPAAIRNALRMSDDPLAEVWADEWVFLTSQSWGIFGRVRLGVEAFARASVHFCSLDGGRRGTRPYP